MKILSNSEYALLKDKEAIVDRLQKDPYADLGYEKSAEILIQIGTRMSHKDQANIILEIGKSWMFDIEMTYNPR